MQMLTHRDNNAVFICSKQNNGWLVTVSGYDELMHPVTERLYCKDITDVQFMVEAFYAIPLLQRTT